jgi:hypothetical protein
MAIYCAALSFTVPFIVGAGSAPYVSFHMSTAWLVLTVYGFLKYRAEGSPSLLGLPLALYWPYMMAALCVRYHCI